MKATYLSLLILVCVLTARTGLASDILSAACTEPSGPMFSQLPRSAAKVTGDDEDDDEDPGFDVIDCPEGQVEVRCATSWTCCSANGGHCDDLGLAVCD